MVLELLVGLGGLRVVGQLEYLHEFVPVGVVILELVGVVLVVHLVLLVLLLDEGLHQVVVVLNDLAKVTIHI